ncbi:MAG: hypothetical protein F4X20_03695 [Dehalococcoidia bacterium]|nr:hypothetical protein [Dehalococcoidia bacterium]
MTRVNLIWMSCLLLLAAGVACTATDTQIERWASKFAQPAIEVTADELYRDYVRDGETATDTYEGRRVRITGTVFEIRDDDDFEPVVEFDVGQDAFAFQSLIAQFAERHRDYLETLDVDDEITTVCYVPVEDMATFDFESVTSLRMCQPIT